jgi:anti-sigma factor RsiW
MDGHDRLLAAFLAGDLDPAETRRFDEHLLECEGCWRAVREDRDGRLAAGLLRRPTPAGLAERIRFAVEVAAAAGPAAQRQAGPGSRSRRWARVYARPRGRWLAAAGAVAARLALTVMALVLPGGRAGVPAAVAAVARYAEAIPAPAGQPQPQSDHRAAPVEVGRPVTITAGGQRIVVRTWRLDGVEAVVAVSGQPFPMPPGAAGASGGGMAWSARLGKLGLYCINGRQPELVAAPVPAAELAGLVSRLPLA